MKKLFTLLILLIVNLGYSQDATSKKSEKIINSEYFHNFKIEKYFIHTNKTTYFSGEKIWFKTYTVEDGSNLPFIESTNLHVNLYNDALELIHSELVYVENGMGHGQFELNKELKQGLYYLQLDSQWNKNFRKKAPLFKIEVINLKDGEIFNDVTPMQKVEFVKNTTTSFNINRNKAVETPQTIAFEINTSSEVIKNKKLKNKYLFAVLHRNGDLKSVLPLQLKKDKISYKIAFSKSDLFNGVNMIALFDEDKKIISEKSFFWTSHTPIDIEITERSKTYDTLSLNLKVFNIDTKANISVSILPEETKLYKNNSNIISSLLIDPYLKTNNYGVASLLSKKTINTNKLDYISKIAISQNTFPYKGLTTSSLHYKNENGITINGKVNTKIKDLSNYTVLLSSNENRLTEVSAISKDHTFTFDKLNFKKASNYSLALINEKGKMEKATFFVYNNYVNYKANNTLPQSLIYKSNTPIKIESTNNNTEYSSLPEYQDAEALDEILITANKKKKQLQIKQTLAKYNILGLGLSKVYKPEDSGFSGGTILDYLQTLPSTTVVYNSSGDVSIQNNRGARTINDTGPRLLSVTVDGVLFNDLTLLTFRRAEEIEYVVLNINGAGYGPLYPNGVIHLITRKGESGKPIVNNPKIQKSKTAFGFNASKSRYEKPELQFTTQNSIDNYSTIDWIPNFEITPGADNILKVNRQNYNNIKIIINGITQDGKPIYKEQILSLSNQ